MIDAGIYIAHLVERKRVGFGQYTLRAVVLVVAIFILEEHGVGARIHLHVDAFVAHLLYGLHVFWAYLRNQLERHLAGKVAEGMGKVERGAPCHERGVPWSDNFVAGDVPHAAYIYHCSSFFWVQR